MIKDPTTHDTLLIKDSLDDLELYTALAIGGGGVFLAWLPFQMNIMARKNVLH